MDLENGAGVYSIDLGALTFLSEDWARLDLTALTKFNGMTTGYQSHLLNAILALKIS